MVGQTISHYRITEKLGAGGMGVVYRAFDVQLERTVALKFLPADASLSSADKEQLLREARSASALDHPNIGVIYGLEEAENGSIFIVMGYYEGETLAHRLARERVPLPEALDLGTQIASGLAHAHGKNIVHRDIKPSNIILTTSGDAKIVDFGLARVVASASATQTLTTSGTLPYMAPEQILGEPVDQRCDVWALGVILAQMLTGSHPFLRENSTATSFAILSHAPAGIETLPANLRAVLFRALSKDKQHRQSGGGEILKGLKAVQSPASASPTGIVLDSTALIERDSSSALREYAERASAPKWQTASPQTSRSRTRLYLGAAAAVLLVAILAVPQLRERLASLLTAGRENHIAVLPFDNIGNDPANEAVAQGLMDSLTSKLSNLDVAQKSLWVVPSSVVRSRKISDPAAAQRELGATMVVKGSIQRQGQDVQMTVNLIDAKTLRQVGSAALEERTGDLAMLQNEAVSKLARLMNINVSADLLRDTGGHATPAAYEAYLKALGYRQRYDKPGNLDLAVEELNNAVKTDPKFALGYAALAETYRMRYGVDPNPKWIDEATVNGSRAIQLDDHIPAVYVTLGSIHSMTGKPDLALQEYQKALAINPRDADALAGIGRAYERMGRIADAEATFQKAAALRPDFWNGYNTLGMFYTRQRKNQEAIAQFKHVIELTPDNALAYINLAAVYLNMGDAGFVPNAEQALKKSIELNPSYPAYANLGSLYYKQKRYADSAVATEKALAFNDKDFRVWSNLIATYQWLKDGAKAAAAREREIPLVEDLAKAQPQDAVAQSELASLYAAEKFREKALLRINAALALAPDDPRVLQNVADAYEILSDRSNAQRSVERALQKGGSLDSLQSDPELQSLLQDAKFRSQAK